MLCLECLHGIQNKVVSNVYDKDKRDQLLTEIRTLYSIKCPWLVRCYGAFFKGTYTPMMQEICSKRLCYADSAISVILEYCNRGSLDNIIQQENPIPEDVLAAMTYQMLKGISYFRNDHRFHRVLSHSAIPSEVLSTSSLFRTLNRRMCWSAPQDTLN